VGFNYWTGVPANIIGAAKHVMKHFDGKIPDHKAALLTFYGIGRKIMMLVLQDSFDKSKLDRKDIGLVVDTHLQTNFTRLKVTNKVKADDIAKEMEIWLHPSCYRRVNEVFAGLRQLWESKGDASRTEKNQETISRIAKKHGLLKEVELVCKT